MACVPSKDSGQPGYLPSLIRVFAVHRKKAWVFSNPLISQRRLWSDWMDGQTDLSLHWAHRSVCWFWHEVAYIYFCHTLMQNDKQCRPWSDCSGSGSTMSVWTLKCLKVKIFFFQELLTAAIGGTSSGEAAGSQSRKSHDSHAKNMESSTFAVTKALVSLISQNSGIKMKKAESFCLSGWYTKMYRLCRKRIFRNLSQLNQLLSHVIFKTILASSWDYGTYHIGDQRRLRRACASAQSHQGLRCSHTWSIEIDKGSDQKSDI